MKYLTQTISVVLVTLLMVSCTNGQNKVAEGTVAENVDVDQFEEHFKESQILDVRTPDEWNEGIIEGAIMINFYDDSFEADLSKLDKDKPVTVYCRSGGRSGKTMAQMNKLGFKTVYNLKGGMNAWSSAKKPTVKP